jgi:uncharacterized protein (DUF736 family)
MAIIGIFTKRDDQFQGTLRTLTLNAELSLLPADKSSDSAPDYRAMAGQAEIGAAWRKTSQQGNDYLLVKLDDPSFDKAVVARLVAMDDSWRLLWSR